MTYALAVEFKAAAKPKTKGGQDPADNPDAPADQQNNGEDISKQDAQQGQSPEWAGDLDESGDESDPADSFASFKGQNGETAWLDRADDGTLTGWVKDSDGSIYRYSDADAWAVDVDDAGMTRSGGSDKGSSDDSSAGGGDDSGPAASAGDPAAGAGDSDSLFGPAGSQGKSVRVELARPRRLIGLPAHY